MVNKLYTGKGDSGTTTLFKCEQGRISKSSPVIDALGAVDELGAHTGFARMIAERGGLLFTDILFCVQNMLFTLQAEIAGAEPKIDEQHVRFVEEEIAKIAEHLPEVKSFVVPGGTEASAYLHVCRTVCRRTERAVIAAKKESPVRASDTAARFLNRLSSLFYALAREANMAAGIKERGPQY